MTTCGLLHTPILLLLLYIGTLKYNTTYQHNGSRYRSLRCSVLKMNIHFSKRKSFGSKKKRITKPCAFPFTVCFVVFVVYIFIFIIYIFPYSSAVMVSRGSRNAIRC